MAHNQKLGNKGELLAQRYLNGSGYKILARNWIFEKAEIDIIAEKDDVIVFVEVKTRSTYDYGNPEEAVNSSNWINMLNAAEGYIEMQEIDKEIRFDVISIVIEDSKERIYHIEDAICPDDIDQAESDN